MLRGRLAHVRITERRREIGSAAHTTRSIYRPLLRKKKKKCQQIFTEPLLFTTYIYITLDVVRFPFALGVRPESQKELLVVHLLAVGVVR